MEISPNIWSRYDTKNHHNTRLVLADFTPRGAYFLGILKNVKNTNSVEYIGCYL
ncbi:hypothetical protein HanXRQr2_Chr06g0267551 [Helianthus annuus]|uniref:Uncharacterized protein n=1 Tax=Helianthus annuus TaxID=4232 RepID=A0A9K3IUI3_HELAN|nr:hypothetical protein HanXRQr2_Chr06g0267551 [Helianthus annuus]